MGVNPNFGARRVHSDDGLSDFSGAASISTMALAPQQVRNGAAAVAGSLASSAAGAPAGSMAIPAGFVTKIQSYDIADWAEDVLPISFIRVSRTYDERMFGPRE